MSLSEIERAVEILWPQQKWELMLFLGERLRAESAGQPEPRQLSSQQVQSWIAEDVKGLVLSIVQCRIFYYRPWQHEHPPLSHFLPKKFLRISHIQYRQIVPAIRIAFSRRHQLPRDPAATIGSVVFHQPPRRSVT